jgi:hypothetical protein
MSFAVLAPASERTAPVHHHQINQFAKNQGVAFANRKGLVEQPLFFTAIFKAAY